ncbi:MAG: D-alanyl-D-alanine carboxypeptidase family protein [Lachnoclostridium edouardi]|uniref:D-alanyl-D-alanine carboxypeptidase family protein n=1 Tax=Lachnoclostridium edouardi TaxID=1926283 RepID=UPI0026DAC546|nr:D-alanyl-D-alanine carboxypeptidase family protein [Lachnoclostridium edouardi]MDO4278616.1 D-alanyl-D-alanine carboxypeptidase family protein [Lachnoclostridium edouardi]
MERCIQIKKRIRTQAAVAAIAVLAVCLPVSGCSVQGNLEDAYSFQERTPQNDLSSEEGSRAKAFASDLCVVEDESLFSDNSISSEAAALFSIDDSSVLFSKNAFETLYPASITKVMTALIAIKYGNLSDQVTVTDSAVITEQGATLCNIKPGDRLTLEQLLYGLMLPSGNDAGAAIAQHMAGSDEAFSQMMNQEAKRLGATGTHFVNAHGLNSADHYTTAYDLYLIFNEALKYEKFRDVIKTTSYYAEYENSAGEKVSQTWKGGNWYMTGERDTPSGLTVFGGKTGTTNAAGYCLIMGSQDNNGKEYISVVLKADSRPGLYENMTNLIHKIVD